MAGERDCVELMQLVGAGVTLGSIPGAAGKAEQPQLEPAPAGACFMQHASATPWPAY